MSKKVGWLLAAAGIAAVLLLLPPPEAAVPAIRTHLAMGSVVTVKLYGEERDAGPLMDLAFAAVDRVDTLMSRHLETSELSRINRLAGDQAVGAAPEMIQILERSQYFAGLSDGAFDLTVGAVSRLWDFPEARVPPDSARLDSALSLVGYQQLQVQDGQVRFLRPGLYLDLGAVGKGFAVDQAVVALQAAGVNCGLVDASGNIRFWGRKPDGWPWRLGVQHPRLPGQYVEVEDLGLPALATSGDYEQYFEYRGERFHHLLDPATGYPARRALSATVWAETATDADILSTAVFVLGPEAGLKLIAALPRTAALVFFEEGGQLRHRSSAGLEGRLRFAAAPGD
ncbi:MAG: FAD:protein FMN transferase [Candidatus Latescibacteria bacterium]|nr:FAD:protein FMN transferase [Candidatus Latescibacterota bacterium]